MLSLVARLHCQTQAKQMRKSACVELVHCNIEIICHEERHEVLSGFTERKLGLGMSLCSSAPTYACGTLAQRNLLLSNIIHL